MAKSSTCFSQADRNKLRLLVGAQLLRACGQAGVIDSKSADQRADEMIAARERVSASEVASLPKQMENCLGLGLAEHDIDANALVLAVRDMSMQLDNMLKQVQTELVGMGERQQGSMVFIDTGFGGRMTTLGSLACEWIAQLSDLCEQSSTLRNHSCVVRYGAERVAVLGDGAGKVTKLLAIGLGLGDSAGKRYALGMSADWAIWLLKLIRTCSVMIACARQLGQEGDDVSEVEAEFTKINDVLGAKVLGELVRGMVDGHKSEWKYLGQLHEVAHGALTWIHLLARRKYDAQALRDQALNDGKAVVAAAATKVLAKAMDEKEANSAVSNALGAGGDLLEALATAHPKCADELRKLGEPASLLGPLPQWEHAALRVVKQDLGIEEKAVQGG